MSIQEIEEAITRLAPSGLAELAAWFEEYQAQAWDEQIARDARAGRFEPLIQHAREPIISKEQLMAVSAKALGIDQLSIEDRLALVEEIWAGICVDQASFPLTVVQQHP